MWSRKRADCSPGVFRLQSVTDSEQASGPDTPHTHPWVSLARERLPRRYRFKADVTLEINNRMAQAEYERTATGMIAPFSRREWCLVEALRSIATRDIKNTAIADYAAQVLRTWYDTFTQGG